LRRPQGGDDTPVVTIHHRAEGDVSDGSAILDDYPGNTPRLGGSHGARWIGPVGPPELLGAHPAGGRKVEGPQA